MFCDNTGQYHSLWWWNGIALQHQKDNSYRKYNESTSHKIAENLPKKLGNLVDKMVTENANPNRKQLL